MKLSKLQFTTNIKTLCNCEKQVLHELKIPTFGFCFVWWSPMNSVLLHCRKELVSQALSLSWLQLQVSISPDKTQIKTVEHFNSFWNRFFLGLDNSHNGITCDFWGDQVLSAEFITSYSPFTQLYLRLLSLSSCWVWEYVHPKICNLTRESKYFKKILVFIF